MLVKSCGVVRFVWNWALDEWQNQHNAGEKPDKFKLSQQLNAIKKEQFPWMLDVSQRCTSQPIKNLGNAFDKFFNKKGGYPKSKKKGAHDRFTLEYNKGCNFEVKGKKIRIQKIGWVRLAEPLRFEGKLLWATVSREADKWFVSIQVEIPDLPKLPKTNKAIGIDVGVREYVDSDKNHYPVPRSFRRTERKLRRLQQSLARKQKGSKNREKAKIKVARCHARIKNIRGDWLHKFTTKIIRENGIIGIEDLNVRGMMKTAAWLNQSKMPPSASSEGNCSTSLNGTGVPCILRTDFIHPRKHAVCAVREPSTSRCMFGNGYVRNVVQSTIEMSALQLI